MVGLYKLIALVNTPNPFFVTFLTRAISGALSLVAVLLFIDTFKHELKTPAKQKWFILLSVFSWLAIFNGIRYSSENISAKLFLFGFCLLFWPKFRRNALGYLVIGFLIGFGFVARYQVGFMIVGLMAWLLFVRRLKFSAWAVVVVGIVLAIACGLTIDHWFYGDWVLTPWRYFAANILQGKADSFSVDPWYMYLSIAGLIPYGPLYILASIYFIIARPKHPITWIMAPFIVGHLLVGHKELRFLTPLLSYMPFVILDSLQVLKEKYGWVIGPKLSKLNTIGWRFNCFVVLVIMFVPSAMQIRINELMYKRYYQPTAFNYLTEGGNILDFYKHPNLRPVPIDNPAKVDCKSNENCLIALTCQETVKYGAPNDKLIFSDCPKWIFKLDFNGWLERTALYNIYELKSVESINK